MAHFAQLDENNIVTQVIVVANDVLKGLSFPASEKLGVEFCQSIFGQDTTWKQASYNGNFRVHFAGIGFTYDAQRDAFIPPQPFLSWNLDEPTLTWRPPVPHPDDGKLHKWDEENLVWVEFVPPENYAEPVTQ